MSTTLFEREALPQLPALRHYAEALTRDRGRSDDLVQETMLKALRYFGTYKEGTNCRAWLFQICKHSFINEYRRKQYLPIPLDFQAEGTRSAGVEGDAHSMHASLDDGSSAQDAHALLGDELSDALHALPPEYQTVLLLKDVEGCTYEEIALFMRVPVGTIRSRIHRARKLLAARVGRYAQSLGYRTN
jgi:RNA polymerase sigma-70 factor (ECF subfamily)